MRNSRRILYRSARQAKYVASDRLTDNEAETKQIYSTPTFPKQVQNETHTVRKTFLLFKKYIVTHDIMKKSDII